MAIFTRWGEPVTITAYHGRHTTTFTGSQLRLVTVLYGNGEERYQFCEMLKADGGIGEIVRAAHVAKEMPLNESEAAKAVQQAE